MPTATYAIKIDWNKDSSFGGTGEDVTARTLSARWSRGRDFASQLFGRSMTGRARIELNNESGDYNSFSTASPLTGNILPGRKVQIQAEGSTVVNAARWTGFITRVIPQPARKGLDTAVIEAMGPLGRISEREIEVAPSTSIKTGTVIGKILDSVNWSTAARDIDVGKTTITRHWTNRQLAISSLREIEVTEVGFLWEKKNGDIAFEDRHARYDTSPKVTMSDSTKAASSSLVHYRRIEQLDPAPFVFNIFATNVRHYDIGNSSAVLWSSPEGSGSSDLTAPKIDPGIKRDFWAIYPNEGSTDIRALAVAAWIAMSSSVDFRAHSDAAGSSTLKTDKITVAVSDFSNARKISITNDDPEPVFITTLQSRGQPLLGLPPVRIRRESTASQLIYGERLFPDAPKFIPDSLEAEDWARTNLSQYKDANPVVRVELYANQDKHHQREVLTLDINDRVTLEANRKVGANLGINEDFFIENEVHTIDGRRNHRVVWELSPASVTGGYWIIGTSKLGTETKLAY